MTTSTQTQLRRGTSAQVAAMTPVDGEPVYNTTDDRIHLGDGATAGGIPHVTYKDVQNQSFIYGTVGGTANAITLTNSPAILSYGSSLRLKFKATSTNSSATTVNVDGLGTKNIYKLSGTSLIALTGNEIVSGAIYELNYDGTQFQMLNAPAPIPPESGLVYLGQMVASGSTSLAFTSLMSSTYEDYVVSFNHIIPATNSVDFYMVTSTDNGASYGTSYSSAADTRDTSTTITNIGGDAQTTMKIATSQSNSSDQGLCGSLNIFNISNTSGWKNFTWLVTGHVTGSTSGIRRCVGSGCNNNINDIDAIKFAFSSGNITSGTIRLYGVQKS